MRRPFILWVAGAVSLVMFGVPAESQDSTGEMIPRSRLAVRLSSGTVGELQYSRFFVPFVSGDFAFQLSSKGPSLGLSVLPFDFLFGQARIGIPLFEGTTNPDGPPPFKPDYMVVIRGGFVFHVRNSRVFLELAAGRLLVIQKRYCETCGGFLPVGVVRSPEVYVTRQESLDLLSLGVGIGF